MAQPARQQVPSSQWSTASFSLPPPLVPAQAGKGKGEGKSRVGPLIGARPGMQPGKSGPAAGYTPERTGPHSFQSAPSFSFFKVPPLPSPQQPAGNHSFGKFTVNAPASSFSAPSFPAVGMPVADAPLAHCPSNASYASNDLQEELNLHPSLNKLKKQAPFEADPTAILGGIMGDALQTGLPEGAAAAIAERKMRQVNPLQKTESQLIAAQAQVLALKEKRRREEYSQAQAKAGPSQIRGYLASRTYQQKIYLLRHGESEANISRRDVPDPNLTHLGMAQAKSWQETIGDFGADVVLVSPLRRAVLTACHAFRYEEVPLVLCRFAREIGWCCNENTIHSTVPSMEKLLKKLPRGDEVQGVEEALVAASDDPPDEMASLQRLKVVLASRPEQNIVVVCHFGVIAALSGCRAKNGDIYECEWGFNDELNVVARHKTPLNDKNCICG